MDLSIELNADGRDSNEVGGYKKSKISDESRGGWNGIEGKNHDMELMETVGTTDGKSDGSGVALCGVVVANVATNRVVVKQLQ